MLFTAIRTGLHSTHSRTVVGQYTHKERTDNPDRFAQIDRPQKHRYIYFVGSKTHKKQLKKSLNYEVQTYPKGESKKYENDQEVAQQMTFI